MTNLFKILRAATALLIAVAAAAHVAHAQGPAQPKSPASPAPSAKNAPVLPAVELSPELLYKIMMAEIAVQRGQAQAAAVAMLEVARETGDPRLAQRATEIAWNARMIREALEAASLWLKADPQSAQARQVVASLLVGQDNLTEARVPLEQWLAGDKANAARNFPQVAQLLSRNRDKKAVLALLRTLAKPYNNIAEVRLTVAQAAWAADDVEGALAESRAALDIKPDLEMGALFHAQALSRRSMADAMTFLERFLERHPKSNDVRLAYARLLSAEKRPAEARKQFEILVAAGHKTPDLIYLALGQIHEERKNYDEALKWYAGVTSGERFVTAQARYAAVLQKQGKLEEARKHLQSIEPRDAAQRQQLARAEADLLREAQAYNEAYDLLGKMLAGAPESVDLLYDQAMIAEKLDRIDVLERNLRKVIELQPDHAHAYNALGYTFADRNQRLPEARQLIEKALELSPEDGFIVDSLGWVLFRMGLTREAVVQLRRAFEMRPEAEVGAHLGEALWVDGKREEAQKIWSKLLQESPANDTLQSTVKRLAPNLLPAAKSTAK